MASSNHRIFTRLLVGIASVPLSKCVSMEYFLFLQDGRIGFTWLRRFRQTKGSQQLYDWKNLRRHRRRDRALEYVRFLSVFSGKSLFNLVSSAFSTDRKQCILVCHDWGAVIGWTFIERFGSMVQKYILMGAPSKSVWAESLMASPDQFWKSWYIFFFQMPCLPEFEASRDDFRVFRQMNDEKFSEYFSREDLEAYKYTFGKRG